MKPGDILLVHSTGLLDRLIQVGEWLHRRDGSCWTTHIACITSADGDTIEAVARGVVRSHISAHPKSRVVDTKLSAEDRAQAVAFAESCLGDEYGYLTIVSIALDLLTPWFFTFKSPRTLICSELAARFLEHAGMVLLELDTSRIMPSDLDYWFSGE